MVLDNLCHINNIPSRLKAEVTDLFKLIVSTRHFKQREDAGTTVACCLFLIQRRYKEAITITTLCKQAQCTKGKFSFFLKYLKSCLSSNEKFEQFAYILDNTAIECTEQDSEEKVADTIESLIRVVCDKAKNGEKAELMEKTAALVKLADSCWLLTGRSPRGVVVASAYLCWKSMHYSKSHIRKTSYPKFCKELGIREPLARLRIPELQDLLVKLGKHIPSFCKNFVNEKNVFFHLNTILEQSESLRNELFPHEYTKEEVAAVEFSNFRYPPLNNTPRAESTTNVQYDPDMHASDIEISDSEIELYLISDSKRKIIELCEQNKLKTILKNQSEVSEDSDR